MWCSTTRPRATSRARPSPSAASTTAPTTCSPPMASTTTSAAAATRSTATTRSCATSCSSCLRHWVAEYHVDGFRFDLASILGRDADGTPLPNPPLLEALAMDPVLGKTKLIAEAWDAGGLYQVGTFPAYGRWAEWNGKYRDCVRKFLKGDMGQVGDMAQRLLGSPDLYPTRGPTASINFVTCHDGFTLADLVSYNDKHNEANGEENRDGANDNHSWNCGVEGPTDDPQILALRRRQIKNALAMLLLSQGVPMLLMGDEVGRTQQGNNNAYCHDSPLTWLDWSLQEQNAELFRFCQQTDRLSPAAPGAPAGPPCRPWVERRRRPTGDLARHAGLVAGLGPAQPGAGVPAMRRCSRGTGRAVRRDEHVLGGARVRAAVAATGSALARLCQYGDGTARRISGSLARSRPSLSSRRCY